MIDKTAPGSIAIYLQPQVYTYFME